jgi:hypothetical protein
MRRFGDHGIDDATGMKLSGHKSVRIYHDYKAVGQDDLFAAVKKLTLERDDESLTKVKDLKAVQQS